jgi:hypothetical protein
MRVDAFRALAQPAGKFIHKLPHCLPFVGFFYVSRRVCVLHAINVFHKFIKVYLYAHHLQLVFVVSILPFGDNLYWTVYFAGGFGAFHCAYPHLCTTITVGDDIALTARQCSPGVANAHSDLPHIEHLSLAGLYFPIFHIHQCLRFVLQTNVNNVNKTIRTA